MIIPVVNQSFVLVKSNLRQENAMQVKSCLRSKYTNYIITVYVSLVKLIYLLFLSNCFVCRLQMGIKIWYNILGLDYTKERGVAAMAITAVGAGRESGIVLPAGTVERLLHVDNGVALRLYLLLCQGANNLDNDTICRRLGVTDEELAKAESCLISHGLASRASQNPCNSEMTRDRESVPVYTREEIASLKNGDMAFSHIVYEAERLIKPLLNESDLRELMTIYSYYGMPADCFITLIHFVAARTASSNDGTKRPSLLTVKKEAYRWLELGINCVEKAEEFVSAELALTKKVNEFEKLLGLSAYSNDERWTLRSWAELGFDSDGVKLAADICIKRKGEIIIVYINRILRGWKNKGFTDAAQIAKIELAADIEREKAKTAAARRGGSRGVNSERELSSAERAALDSLFND